MRLPVAIVTALALLACQRTETPQQAEARIGAESQAARAELGVINEQWKRAFTGGNVDAMASIMDETVVTLPPNLPMITGRQAWVAWFGPQLKLGNWNEVITTQSVVASGPIAVQRGGYILTFTPLPNAPKSLKAVTDTGKYVWHMHKKSGKWLLTEAIWNSDRPVAP
jgi:ketosteroid isomerase-like protein